MSESNEVVTEPMLERRTRRRFSVADKQRLLVQADVLPHGEQGAWLRRNGLYAAQLSQRRKALAQQGLQGLAAKPGGRKPADARIARSSACAARTPTWPWSATTSPPDS